MEVYYESDDGLILFEDDPDIYILGNPMETKYYHRLRVWVENQNKV